VDRQLSANTVGEAPTLFAQSYRFDFSKAGMKIGISAGGYGPQAAVQTVP